MHFRQETLIRHFLNVIFLNVCLIGSLSSQLTPRISNFSESTYKAHHQNWSVTSSKKGLIYFGNKDGLIAHNGVEWFKYPLPNNKIIRSVLSKNERIYTGGYDEFGYWLVNDCGEHTYHSLNKLIPNDALKGEEIWNIVALGEHIYFQSFAVILVYNGKTIKRIKAPGAIMFMQVIDDQIWLPVIGNGIYRLESDSLKLLPGTTTFREEIITGMIPCKGKSSECVLIGTSKQGLFFYENSKIRKWDNVVNASLKEYQINKLLKLPNDEILIGTIRSGLYILDEKFSVKYHLNVNNGLQNNTILSVFSDIFGNIWLGLDKGITCLHYKDEVVMLKDRTGQLGAAYSVAYLKNNIYLGTNQGLFVYNNNDKAKQFELVKGTQGQVWQLLKLNDNLLCGHNEGTFLIEENKATKISDVTGGWFTTVAKGENEVLIQGNYTGLVVFKLNKGNVEFSHKVEGINEPVKKIVQLKEREFWVSGPNKGLKKVKLNEDYTKTIEITDFTKRPEFKNSINFDIDLLQNRLCVFNGLNHFKYDENNDSFVENQSLQNENSNFFLRNLNDSIYVKIYDNEISFHKGTKLLRKERITANKDYSVLFEDDKKRVGICTNEGFDIFDLTKLNSTRSKIIQFHKAISIQDQKCFSLKNKEEIKIPFESRDLRIHFLSDNFNENKILEYKLLPKTTTLSAIPNNRYIDLYGLRNGKYTLEVTDGNASQFLKITIGYPWYLKWWAWIFYVGIIFLISYILNFILANQLKKQEQKLKTENERIIREKMIQIENENLQQENLRKSKDLANVTSRLVEKNELLLDIKNEIIEIRKSGDQKLTPKDYNLFMKQINDNLTLQNDKKLFNVNFEDIHREFLKKLKNEFPTLTADDLKCASYLRMNLSSKEIAPLLNISLRGLENKRYRLRKKINLNSNLDLNEFFINYFQE